MQDASGQHGSYSELASNLLRVYVQTFVAKDRAARHHSEFRQLRQRVDDAFRNAIAEILHLCVGTDIDQRQNCQRVDYSARGSFPSWGCQS